MIQYFGNLLVSALLISSVTLSQPGMAIAESLQIEKLARVLPDAVLFLIATSRADSLKGSKQSPQRGTAESSQRQAARTPQKEEVIGPKEQIISRADFTPWMNGEDYQKEFDRQAAKRHYPIKVEGRTYKGGSQYRAIFEPFLPELLSFYSCHSLQEQPYIERNKEYLSKGYKQIHLQTFTDHTGIKRYQATWIRIGDESFRRQQRAIQPAGQSRIAGVVRDETGKPIDGVRINIMPEWARTIRMYPQGRFELSWEPQSRPGRPFEHYLVASHLERNLAAAVEINEDTRTLDITLMPGVILTGKVVDSEGKGIAGARIMTMLWGSTWGSSLPGGDVRTDAEGKFEVTPMPPNHKYSVTASGEGYSHSRVEIRADDAIRDQVEVGQLTLRLANLSVSGMVVAADGKPVSDARVFCSGEGQPDHSTQTDTEGRFTLDKICAGRIRLIAAVDNPIRLYGSIVTDGGASDIKLVISESSPVVRYIPDQTPSLVGRSLLDLKNLGIDLSTTDANDKMILVGFWDMEQRPSRYCMRELAKRADQLKEKGVIVLAVQSSKVDENALNEWVEENNTPFPIGMIRQDVERIRFSWGVKALPWLILTDHKHIVRAEGFDSGELEKKIGIATLLAGDVDQIQLQISKGVDVNTKDEGGLTALHLAARQDRKDAAELLLANGANINARLTGWPGWTPLHEAAAANHMEVAELLIAEGADINTGCARAGGGRFGGTPLHEAAFEGHRDMAELLISRSADINAKQSGGLTPLDVAAFVGHRDVVELLIGRGADVNIRDKGGRTALRWAVHGRHKEIVELLQEHGAEE